MRYLEVGCRVLLAAVFIVAVANKVASRAAWRDFVRSLRELRQLPEAAVRPAAVATVTAEALAAALFLVPLRVAGVLGFALAIGLLAAFTVVIGLALARGNRAPCRCFGASSTPLGIPHLVRNLTLICVAALGVLGLSTGTALDPAYAMIAGITGLVLGMLTTAAEDIVALVKPVR
ncbi:methylamine utilization protein MauE [Plantactinospora sp. BC1]|uniref:MauE/DoxX family redox-associated membrane protein n=1 Tax=Plantactinospora sp. BC1 TaxID=2108470 RepID=UPI000D1730F0|nr:MauE/DoxX family redox-associated membrane protein [Plantactinospora sp. BC1]AVT29269.1 methylamine utilization protein MauE [Plantactinospora sp. BC1]